MWPGLRFSSTGEAAWVLFDCNDLAELTRMIKALAGATGMKPQNAPAADTMSPGLRLVRSLTGTFLYVHKCSMLTRSWCTLHQYYRL